jgi:hypothetical protein
MAAIQSQGTKLYYSDGGSPTSFVQVTKVTNLRGLGGGSAGVIDASDLDSSMKEKLMGLPDEGQLVADLNFDPDAVSHQALRTARRNRTRVEFKIVFADTTPAIAQFFGYVLTMPVDVAMNDKLKVSLTIEIDGEVIWS